MNRLYMLQIKITSPYRFACQYKPFQTQMSLLQMEHKIWMVPLFPLPFSFSFSCPRTSRLQWGQ